MVATPAFDAHGLALTFPGWVANIISVDGPSWVREALETVHMGTVTWKTKIPADLVDPGEVSGECQFDATTLPPITGVPGTLSIVWGDTAADAFSSSGFMTNFSIKSGSSGAIATASFTFTLTGAPTITPGA